MAVSTFEGFVLGGLNLNTATTFGLAEVAFPPPRQRQEWIGAADSEHQALVRNPLHENREITAKIQVHPQADMDDALDQIAALVDVLRSASRSLNGIELVWTPANANYTCNFDVLAGEIIDLPIDITNGWLVSAPTLTIVLKAKPYWRGESVSVLVTSSTEPVVTLEIPDVPGDQNAQAILVVTDAATQNRRHVEWGLEGPDTYDPTTSLLIDSESMVTAGFSGAAVSLAGGYDPPASGGDNAIGGFIYTSPQALVGLPNLDHVGVFRVKARVMTSVSGMQCRLAWQVADGPFSANPWVNPTIVCDASFDTWGEIDLGTVTIPAVVAGGGTQKWTGRIEAYTPSGGELYVDYLVLIPAGAGYGKARAAYAYSPGVVSAYDEFTTTTSGGGLNARAAPLGGTWATSGATTDFVFADDLSGEQIKRFTGTDTGPRWAILGSATYTNTRVQVLHQHSNFASGAGVFFTCGVIARWVDSSNYLRAFLELGGFPNTQRLVITRRVTGTDLEIASLTLPSNTVRLAEYFAIRLTVFDSGRAIAEILEADGSSVLATVEGSSTTLATGGALDDGKPGLFEHNISSTMTRWYDDFFVTAPPAEPIVVYSGQSMQIRYDDVIRDDATGTYTGRPQSYRGSRFTIPPGDNRVLVKARRADIEAAADQYIADNTSIEVGYVARGLVVPRA